MTKLTIWDPNVGDRPANLALTNNFAATTNPTASDDVSLGYSPGSVWINGAEELSFVCIDATEGAAAWLQTSSAGEQNAQFVAPDGEGASLTGGAAAAATDPGEAASVVGGAGGATSGVGGPANVTGGAASGGNSGGGSVVLTGGAKNGTGIDGGVRAEDVLIRQIAAPAARTTSALLTGAQVAAGMITVTQGGGANSAQQLPTGTDLQAALPADFAVGDSIDFHVINLGGASETATLTVNTDVTIVGRAVVDVAAATASGSGHFRLRKTADHVFVCYRVA